MTDIALDENWDISFDEETGDLNLVSGIEETSQASRFRLQIVRGELFEDESIGVPWLTDMVDPRVGMDAKKQILRNTILSSPGAIDLTSLSVEVDTSGRIAISEFSGIAEEGEFTG